MIELKFYDKDFNHICTLYKAISVIWNLKYRGFGSFEAHFSVNQDIGQLIKNYKFLIVCEKDRQAIITSKEINGEEIIFYGKELSYMLYKKVVPEFSARKGSYGTTTGEIASTIINKVMGDIENFSAENLELLDYPMDNTWRLVTHPLSEILNELCSKNNTGYKVLIDFENKKWILRFYKGTEIPLIMSEGNRNAHSANYTETLEDYALDSYYYASYENMGEWDAETNTPVLTDFSKENYGKKYKVTANGSLNGKIFEKGGYAVSRSEDGEIIFSKTSEGFWKIVKSEEPDTGMWRWQRTTSLTKEDEVLDEITKHLNDNMIRLKSRNVKFGNDYGLGDVFTVKYEKNGLLFTKKVRVYSVRIFEDEFETGERPSFKEEE